MRLAINVLSGDLELASTMCRAEGIGAEVTALAFPETLDSHDFDLRVAEHGAALEGVRPLSSHGPFLDLYVTSRDPRILTVCRDRHEKALKASIDLSATIYVAHLGLVPLIRNRGYLADFASRPLSSGFLSPKQHGSMGQRSSWKISGNPLPTSRDRSFKKLAILDCRRRLTMDTPSCSRTCPPGSGSTSSVSVLRTATCTTMTASTTTPRGWR